MNTLGQVFKVTTFGESHGEAVGCVVDGAPAGILLNEEDINAELRRRRPGQSALTTPRAESDAARIISGTFEGKTTGAPITILINNNNQNSKDYSALKNIYRPSHADMTYDLKYGIRDYRGGGRSSARWTAGLVAAGALAQKFLREAAGIEFLSHTVSAGKVKHEINPAELAALTRAQIENNALRCPYAEAPAMEAEVLAALKDSDSLGSAVCGVIKNLPAGLGEPMFDKLSARLAQAIFSINAVKGFEIGNGFAAAELRGSENNDAFVKIGQTEHNRAGGVLGGISTGELMYFKAALKPTPTIAKEQRTVDADGKPTVLAAAGRHDPCLAPRAVPVIDAAAAIVIMDLFLINRGLK